MFSPKVQCNATHLHKFQGVSRMSALVSTQAWDYRVWVWIPFPFDDNEFVYFCDPFAQKITKQPRFYESLLQ